MRIRELAELTGNTPETIRYYEKQGLLPNRAVSPITTVSTVRFM